VEERKEANMMSVLNLAIVFAPSFLRDNSGDKTAMLMNVSDEQEYDLPLVFHLKPPPTHTSTHRADQTNKRLASLITT
jgi:hypothetical protein